MIRTIVAGGVLDPNRPLFGRHCSQIHRGQIHRKTEHHEGTTGPGAAWAYVGTAWAGGPLRSDHDYLRLTFQIARQARAAGNHPFGAILVGPDGAVLMQAGNAHGDAGDRTGHAERVLMTRASLDLCRRFPGRLHDVRQCRTLCDVRGFGLLGRRRPRGLRLVGARSGRADRPASGKPDDGPALPHRFWAPASARSRSSARCWKTRLARCTTGSGAETSGARLAFLIVTVFVKEGARREGGRHRR